MPTDQQFETRLRNGLARLSNEITPSPELIKQLLTDNPRRLRRRRTTRLSVGTAIAAGVVVAFIVFSAIGDGPSIAARAYAATSPTGAVVHYVRTFRLTASGDLSKTERVEVWQSGARSRLVYSFPGTSRTEQIAVDRTGVEIDRAGVISRHRLPAHLAHGNCSAGRVLDQLCLNNAQNDPITALRHLAKSGGLDVAGRRTLHGRAVDLLTGTTGAYRIQAFVDAHTYVPAEIRVTTSTPRAPGIGPIHETTIVTGYQRLPLDEHNLENLGIQRDPRLR